MSAPLLCVQGLKTYFRTRLGLVKAVDGVDLEVYPGECLGLVGESGSGKSVALVSVMGLVRKPGWIEGGSIRFAGRELARLDEQAMRELRGKEIALIMQDALTALNPAFTVANQIIEVLAAHGEAREAKRSKQALRARAA
jgi:ABC-type dipeptide/oligopeptide/nickel transport system ATPase component